VARPIERKTCESCGTSFLAKQLIDGKVRSLYRRRFCLDCSPFGAHNTSKDPPGASSEVRISERKRRRQQGYLRYQRRRRKRRKDDLIALKGGRCVDCGYDRSSSALQFHHREGTQKDFILSTFTGSTRRLLAEAEKCDLVCANCHRVRHAAVDDAVEASYFVLFRREVKATAIRERGGRCESCGFSAHQSALEFHHLDPSQKEFGFSARGIVRSKARVAAELAKCVLLCANCHAERHAGVATAPQPLAA